MGQHGRSQDTSSGARALRDSPQTWNADMLHMSVISESENMKIRHCVLFTVST